MLQAVIWDVLYSVIFMVHQLVFILFAVSFIRVVFFKHTPYSAFYLASICLIQAVYNGCPVTDINNYLAIRAAAFVDTNQFWGGIFGEYTLAARLVSIALGLILYYYSYKAWDRIEVPVDFGRIFRGSAVSKLLVLTKMKLFPKLVQDIPK